MNVYLAKTEPNEYSISDLEKDGKAPWDGVTNFQAVRAIKQMQVGDLVLIYHSGKDPGIVGLAEVIKTAEKDPKNSKSYIPEFKFKKEFKKKVLLSEIKESGLFDDFALVRQGRLSTMLVPEKFVKWLEKQLGESI